MLSLTYASRAVEPFDADAMSALLRHSRENNTRAGLTGMLMYKEGRFMQVLEGEDDAVRRLYAIIAADPRHDDVRMLLDDQIPERRFAEWSMACPTAPDSDLRGILGFDDVFATGVRRRHAWEDPSRAQLLLDWFRRSL